MSRLRSLPFVALLLAPGFAFAQPVDGTDCPPGTEPIAPIGTTEICTARILDVQTRIQALGARLCANTDPSANKAAEERLAKEFGEVATECADGLLETDSPLLQTYLYSWLNGPSDGWGDDAKVNGVVLPPALRAYRNSFVNTWEQPAASDALPAWFRNEGAYSEAITALVTAARQSMGGSSYALNQAQDKIDRYKTWSGLGNDHPRVKFLTGILERLRNPQAGEIPAELAETYAASAAVRVNGPSGFYTQWCDPKAAKDDSLTDGLSLLLGAHLLANGATSWQHLDGAMNAMKSGYTSWSRAETAFGAEMTGAWMANWVKKTYFADDPKVQDVSEEMSRALANAVNAPLRERYGLPAAAPITDESGDALGLAGSKFDSNDNLRVVFPDACDLVGVHHVNADGSTGAVLSEHQWDARGIYTEESFVSGKDFPVSELVFKETTGTNKDRARSYDVVMKCGSVTRKTRLSIPPRPDTAEPIDFVTPDTAPPYEGMLADGRLNGVLVGGYHTRDGEVSVRALKEQGFREVSRNEDISIRDRFFELLGEKKADGKPALDYFVKDAHANGYAFDAGMFRSNKRGIEVVLEKRGPDGKPHRVTVLGNKEGEGKEGGPEGFDTVEYSKFFEVMGKRGDATTFIANFSCWSLGKSAFEWDGIRSNGVKYLPTDKSASYWERYWSGLGSHENTFQIIGALDKKMSYERMRDVYSNFDSEIIMPDDPTFVSTVTDSIKSHRASSSGIPVTVSLQESRPNS